MKGFCAINWTAVPEKFFFSFQYVLWGKEWVSWKKSFLGTFLLQIRGYFNSDDYITSSYIYV